MLENCEKFRFLLVSYQKLLCWLLREYFFFRCLALNKKLKWFRSSSRWRNKRGTSSNASTVTRSHFVHGKLKNYSDLIWILDNRQHAGTSKVTQTWPWKRKLPSSLTAHSNSVSVWTFPDHQLRSFIELIKKSFVQSLSRTTSRVLPCSDPDRQQLGRHFQCRIKNWKVPKFPQQISRFCPPFSRPIEVFHVFTCLIALCKHVRSPMCAVTEIWREKWQKSVRHTFVFLSPPPFPNQRLKTKEIGRHTT